MAITDGIISAWRLEETSGDLIDFVSSNNLTPTSVTYGVTGKVNNAVSFDGTATSKAIITNANQVNLNITSIEDRTFAFWFKTTTAGSSLFFDKRSAGDSPTGSWGAAIVVGVIQLFFVDDSGTFVILNSNTTGLNDNNFHLAVFTFTRSVTGLRLYIDNVEDTASPVDVSSFGSVATNGNFTMGGSGFSSGNQYNGILDEVIIWDRIITSGERTTLWNGGAGTNIFSPASTTVTNGIISAWRMEDSSGNLTDSVGANTLTGSNLSYLQTGKVTNAIGLNGSSSTASITNAAQIGLNVGLPDSRTIAVWFKSSTAVEQTVFGKSDDSAPGEFYEMIMDSVGGVNVVFGNFSTVAAYVRSNSGYLNGTYHLAFVTFTRKSKGLRLFVDNSEYTGGSQPSPQDTTTVADLTNASDFRVGKRVGATSWWNGNLDEFIIWDRVLTSTERNYVWNSGSGRNIFVPPSAPVISTISISTAVRGVSTAFSITGTDLDGGNLALKFVQVGASDISVSVISITPSSANGLVTFPETASGVYDLVATTDIGTGSPFINAVTVVFIPTPNQTLRGNKYYLNGQLKFARRVSGNLIYS